uniref:Mitogen-activated protein kinase n=1 Tax=Scophthalmus maximus TaxID=52904 RepID=A0A8D3DPY8_SCOMX
MALCATATINVIKMMAAYNGGSSAVAAHHPHHHQQLQHLPPPHMHHHHHLQHPGSAAAVHTVQQHTSTAAVAAAVMLNSSQQQPYFPSPAPGQAPGPAAPAQVQATAVVKAHHHHHQQQQQHAHHLQQQLDMEPDRPIGYGAFGVVWSVTDPRDGKQVALKKMPNVFQNLVSCKRVFRELKMLCFFKHENVLSALDILQPPHIDYFEEIYVVTELMQSDLHKIIVSPQPLSSDHAKVFLYQILRGLKYLHSAGILHRDIKPGNLLVNSNCVLKICDFGLARVEESDESRHMTQEVVTQYYRAPEILMGSRHYSNSIDIWSVGCIFAELLGRRILFQAQSPIQQLDLITDLLGTPSMEAMRTACEGARAHILRGPHKQPSLPVLYTLSSQATHEAVHLLCRMLVFDQRLSINSFWNSRRGVGCHSASILSQQLSEASSAPQLLSPLKCLHLHWCGSSCCCVTSSFPTDKLLNWEQDGISASSLICVACHWSAVCMPTYERKENQSTGNCFMVVLEGLVCKLIKQML